MTQQVLLAGAPAHVARRLAVLLGFGSMLRYELGRWWATRYWLGQLLLWTALVGGILAAALWGTPEGPNPAGLVSDRVAEATRGMALSFGIIASIGAIVAAQGVLLGERQDGTLAWVLSLPVSRASVLLAKALAHGAGLLVTAMAAQGVLAAVLLQARLGPTIPPVLLVSAVALFGLHLLFYLSLALLLGTLVPSRGWVVALGVVALLAQEIALDALGPLGEALPSALTKHLAQPLLASQPITSAVPILATIGWIVVCLGGAAWRLDLADL
jgi:ABC-2 type transport system permease protein